MLLLNLHIWFIAYIYAPNGVVHRKEKLPTTSGSANIQDMERERNNIMKEFYENELQDEGTELDQSFVES